MKCLILGYGYMGKIRHRVLKAHPDVKEIAIFDPYIQATQEGIDREYIAGEEIPWKAFSAKALIGEGGWERCFMFAGRMENRGVKITAKKGFLFLSILPPHCGSILFPLKSVVKKAISRPMVSFPKQGATDGSNSSSALQIFLQQSQLSSFARVVAKKQ